MFQLGMNDGDRDRNGDSHNKSSREVVSFNKNADVIAFVGIDSANNAVGIIFDL